MRCYRHNWLSRKLRSSPRTCTTLCLCTTGSSNSQPIRQWAYHRHTCRRCPNRHRCPRYHRCPQLHTRNSNDGVIIHSIHTHNLRHVRHRYHRTTNTNSQLWRQVDNTSHQWDTTTHQARLCCHISSINSNTPHYIYYLNKKKIKQSIQFYVSLFVKVW